MHHFFIFRASCTKSREWLTAAANGSLKVILYERISIKHYGWFMVYISLVYHFARTLFECKYVKTGSLPLLLNFALPNKMFLVDALGTYKYRG